jgi:hypothetical protein
VGVNNLPSFNEVNMDDGASNIDEQKKYNLFLKISWGVNAG